MPGLVFLNKGFIGVPTTSQLGIPTLALFTQKSNSKRKSFHLLLCLTSTWDSGGRTSPV